MAKGPFANMRFSRVDVSAKMANGKVVQRSISDPRGISYEEYQRLNTGMLRAFGESTRVVGTPIG